MPAVRNAADLTPQRPTLRLLLGPSSGTQGLRAMRRCPTFHRSASLSLVQDSRRRPGCRLPLTFGGRFGEEPIICGGAQASFATIWRKAWRDGRRKYSGRTSRSSSVIENARLGLNNYSDHVSQKEGLDCHCIKGVRRATRDVAEAGHAEMWARVEKHSAAPRTPWRFESEACGRTVSYIDSSRRSCGTVLEPEFIGKTF